MPESQSGTVERLARLESGQNQVVEAFQGLTVQLTESQRRSDERFEAVIADSNRKFREVYRKFDADHKTPWAAFALATTVVLALIAAFGSQYTRDLTRVERDLDALDRTVVDRIRLSEFERGRAAVRTEAAKHEHDSFVLWLKDLERDTDAHGRELAKQGERDRLGERPTFERLDQK